MIDERYTPLTRAEADRLMESIRNQPAARFETASVLKDGAVVSTTRLGTARSRAQALGWNIDPETSPGNPHAFDTGCVDKRCPCHGKTFAHYRRGA